MMLRVFAPHCLNHCPINRSFSLVGRNRGCCPMIELLVQHRFFGLLVWLENLYPIFLWSWFCRSDLWWGKSTSWCYGIALVWGTCLHFISMTSPVAQPSWSPPWRLDAPCSRLLRAWWIPDCHGSYRRTRSICLSHSDSREIHLLDPFGVHVLKRFLVVSRYWFTVTLSFFEFIGLACHPDRSSMDVHITNPISWNAWLMAGLAVVYGLFCKFLPRLIKNSFGRFPWQVVFLIIENWLEPCSRAILSIWLSESRHNHATIRWTIKVLSWIINCYLSRSI